MRLSELRSVYNKLVKFSITLFPIYFLSAPTSLTSPSDAFLTLELELLILFCASRKASYFLFNLFSLLGICHFCQSPFSDSFLCFFHFVSEPIQWIFYFGNCMLSSKIYMCFFSPHSFYFFAENVFLSITFRRIYLYLIEQVIILCLVIPSCGLFHGWVCWMSFPLRTVSDSLFCCVIFGWYPGQVAYHVVRLRFLLKSPQVC